MKMPALLLGVNVIGLSARPKPLLSVLALLDLAFGELSWGSDAICVVHHLPEYLVNVSTSCGSCTIEERQLTSMSYEPDPNLVDSIEYNFIGLMLQPGSSCSAGVSEPGWNMA